MGQYSIKEVETLSGVKAHTLRIWEQRYDFLKPKRTDTNIRYYTDEQLRLLLNIGTLNRNGMKISKIAELGKENLGAHVLNLYEETEHATHLLDALIHSMLDFDEQRFEKTLNSAIKKMGFQEAFTQLIFPFLSRTGVLWTAGEVRVAQEHFISNLVRRKIMVAIDKQQLKLTKNSKKIILFLPEGENHELQLLFSDFLLREKNHQTAYLGASLPLNELGFITDKFKPDYLVVFATVPLQQMSFHTYLKKLSSLYPRTKVIAGGTQLDSTDKLPANCLSVKSIQEFLKLI